MVDCAGFEPITFSFAKREPELRENSLLPSSFVLFIALFILFFFRLLKQKWKSSFEFKYVSA